MTIKEAIKKFGTSTFMNGGNIKSAESKLHNGEDVLFALTGNVATLPINGSLDPQITTKDKTPGVFVVTNQKVYFCQSILGSSIYKEIRINDIQSVEGSKNIATAQLKICGLTEMFVVDMNRKILSEAENIISEARNSFTRTSQATSAKSENGNNMDDLRKLKSLLDDGIITQEDFDKKKASILGI